MAVPRNVTPAFEAGKVAFRSILAGLERTTQNGIPEVVRKYILARPGLSLTQVAAIILMAIPNLIWSPAILALGVTQVGPTAGGVFAAMQSMFGTNALMAVLQSAGMGGIWGAGILSGFTKGAAVLIAGFAQWLKMRKGSARI